MKTYLNIPVFDGVLTRYINVRDIPAKHRKDFLEWMNYDTGIEDPFLQPSNKMAHLYDFERWYEQNVDPGPGKTFFGISYHRSEEGGFSYICMEDVPEEYREEFGNWMSGQTVSAGPECANGSAIYLWDFERWYKMKFKNEPTYFD